MTRLTRYILRQLVIGTAMVALGLAFIVWLTQSLRFLQFIMGRGLPLGTWLELTALMLPTFLALILPVALFVVVLFVYHKLGQDRELVVVQAAGVSRVGLARPALAAGAGMTAIGFALSLWLVPAATRVFKDLQWSIRNDVTQILLRAGAFNQLNKDLTVYVRDRDEAGTLYGILVHDTRDPKAEVTLMAERGRVLDADPADPDGGTRIVLDNGNRQQLARDAELSVLYFDSYAIDLGKAADAESRWLDNGERSLTELLTTPAGDGLGPEDIRRMRAEGHERLARPWAGLGYTIIALAWLLTGDFDKRGGNLRVIAAAASVLALEAAMLGAVGAAASQPAWIAAMYAVGLLPVAAGLYVIAGERRAAALKTLTAGGAARGCAGMRGCR
ncbi:MAG: LPS export ABC transporter permease LptF [Rhodospirillaceae bacterium]|nr:LPS export ABC transporter permease LptF [Rhodospirillaceae bacterium]